MNPSWLFGPLALVLALCQVAEWLLSDDQKSDLSNAIERDLLSGQERWYTTVNEAFQILFDLFYGFDNKPFERLVWLGIIGSYIVLFMARVVIYASGFPLPDPPLILTTAIFVSTSAVLLSYGAFRSTLLVNYSQALIDYTPLGGRSRTARTIQIGVVSLMGGVGTTLVATTATWGVLPAWVLGLLTLLAAILLPPVAVALIPESRYPLNHQSGRYQAITCLITAVCGMFLYVGSVASISVEMGGGHLLIVSMAVGTMIIAPLAYIPFLVQEYLRSINPLRAILSSLLFVLIVGSVFRDAGTTFITELAITGYLTISYLVFNIFADAISLMETRWILRKSKHFGPIALAIALVGDIVLSAGIYLILPLFVGQNLSELLLAITFRGPDPWMGILFWSTFSTSLLFYLFVLAVVVSHFVRPIVFRIFGVLRIFDNYDDHPALLIGLAVDGILVVFYIAYGLIQFTI